MYVWVCVSHTSTWNQGNVFFCFLQIQTKQNIHLLPAVRGRRRAIWIRISLRYGWMCKQALSCVCPCLRLPISHMHTMHAWMSISMQNTHMYIFVYICIYIYIYICIHRVSIQIICCWQVLRPAHMQNTPDVLPRIKSKTMAQVSKANGANITGYPGQKAPSASAVNMLSQMFHGLPRSPVYGTSCMCMYIYAKSCVCIRSVYIRMHTHMCHVYESLSVTRQPGPYIRAHTHTKSFPRCFQPFCQMRECASSICKCTCCPHIHILHSSIKIWKSQAWQTHGWADRRYWSHLLAVPRCSNISAASKTLTCS